MFWNVIAILVLDAFLALVTLAILAGIWNAVAREKLKVRNNLAFWVCLLASVVVIGNAVVISRLVLAQGGPTLFSFVSVLVLDAILLFFTWFLIAGFWNNVVREGLKVRNNLVWGFLLGIIVLTVNAGDIAYLLQ